MNKITSLTIPEDILNNKSMSSDEKLMRALQMQYPDITYREIAETLNVTTRHLYNIRKGKKSEHAFRKAEHAFLSDEQKQERAFLSQETNPPQNEAKNRNAPSENRNTPSDSELQDKKNRAYIKAIKFFKGLHTEQEKDENQVQINKIFACKDLFTQEQFDEFDEILSALL